jgi:transcriptional regulator with XRE-family HTH domain
VLSRELRKARIASGLTQEKLAAKANLSREYVNYLEKGKREPTISVFVRLCKAMSVYPPTLLARAMKRGL